MTNPFTSLLHSVLSDVHSALASARNIEVGILGDFNAGVAQIVQSGRQATDTELHALGQLASAITSPAEPNAAVSEAGDANAPSAQVTGSSEGEPSPAEPTLTETDPSVADPTAAEVQDEVNDVGGGFALEEGAITDPDALFAPQVDENDGG